MAKLTKAQIVAHERAAALLASTGRLTSDDVVQVIQDWHEGANHANTRASAIFSSFDLARHAALEVEGQRVLDLCAGIGTLAVAVAYASARPEGHGITLVELNPDYAAVARRLLPEAEVIVGSMYDRGLTEELRSRRFDVVVSNPPFGSFSKNPSMKGPRYHGGEAHYDAIDIASDLADSGVFILPQTAVPFTYSGRQTYLPTPKGGNLRYDRFEADTGIVLEMNMGIDTSAIDCFRGVTITVEIALADFVEARRRRQAADMPLFGALAA